MYVCMYVCTTRTSHKKFANIIFKKISHLADNSSMILSKVLRRRPLGEERQISIIGDMKRQSPTSPHLPKFVSSFNNAVRSREKFDVCVCVCVCVLNEKNKNIKLTKHS
jgi:hypothetical protein